MVSIHACLFICLIIYFYANFCSLHPKITKCATLCHGIVRLIQLIRSIRFIVLFMLFWFSWSFCEYISHDFFSSYPIAIAFVMSTIETEFTFLPFYVSDHILWKVFAVVDRLFESQRAQIFLIINSVTLFCFIVQFLTKWLYSFARILTVCRL